MSQKGALHVLNILALELKFALMRQREPDLPLPEMKMARHRFDRASAEVRRLGFSPVFARSNEGELAVTFKFLDDADMPQQERVHAADLQFGHMYGHGDIDDRDFEEEVVEQRVQDRMHNLPPSMATVHGIVRGACGRDEEGWFLRAYNIPRAERERGWLMDDTTEIVIYEDGEVLIDAHDEKKTRQREQLHTGEGVK